HRSEEARLQQLAAVFQWTGRDRSRPHLLMGDFNALAPADYDGRSEALEALGAHERGANLVKDGVKVVPRVLARGYVDAMAASAMDIGPTYPTRELLIRIDYVWASAALAGSIRWCRRWQTEETAVASDHLPVLAEIDL
ncbi:MAG: endonuclease/exonuclease/phosphatase family protein, partial [Anaerolineae bacterium]